MIDVDISSSWLARGEIVPGRAVIASTSADLANDVKEKVERLLPARIPEFVLGSLDKPRMLVVEDGTAFYMVKLVPGSAPGQARFILATLQGKAYSQAEIQKLSMEIAKILDPNLDDAVMHARLRDTMIHAEPYDFLRPIKMDGARESILTEDEAKLRVDEILPLVNRLKLASTTQERIKLAKLRLLLASKSHATGDATVADIESLPSTVASWLDGDTSTGEVEAGAIWFNLGLVARQLGQLEMSTRFFEPATATFERARFARLAMHARFNQFLNARERKRAGDARDIVQDVARTAGETGGGFAGIVNRHLAETLLELGDTRGARDAFQKALTFLDTLYYSADTASIHSALGVLAFREGNFFEAAKSFTIAINIFAVMKKEVSGLAKNLGISYLSLAGEYLRAARVLLVEKDVDTATDLILRGSSYAALAVFYLGKESIETTSGVARSLLSELRGLGREGMPLVADLDGFCSVLEPATGETTVRGRAKAYFEAVKAHQPLKTYYVLVLYKNNGLAVFTRESSTLHELPAMDGDLIGGMISGISSFLGEVLAGDEVLSLIDRNDVKIVFEHTPHFMGIVFCNKDTPRLRNDLHVMLDTVETSAGRAIEQWSGDMTIFKDFETLSGAIIQ